MPRNQDYWLELEEHELFKDETNPEYQNAWRWLNLLREEGRLRSIDIMRIGNLVETAYRAALSRTEQEGWR